MTAVTLHQEPIEKRGWLTKDRPTLYFTDSFFVPFVDKVIALHFALLALLSCAFDRRWQLLFRALGMADAAS